MLANKIKLPLLAITFSVGLLINTSIGFAAPKDIRITVRYMIVAPTCTINDNNAMSVDFSDVLTQKIGGKNYIKQLGYSLKCTGSNSDMYTMTIQGSATSFNNSALKTNITDFGIALFANDNPLKINEPISFSQAKKPVLQAVPVKAGNARLKGGDFTATAVMKISYQ